MTVFCDWLDVTCHPESSFISSLSRWAVSKYPVAFADEESGRVIYEIGYGKLVVEEKRKFHRASASGGVLQHLRDSGHYGEYLSVLSTTPHAVTRLDAALDLSIDGPDVLRALEARYPDDLIKLTHKPMRIKRFYSTRLDGQLTGTWYVGHRSRARVSARVYDKQAEAFDVRGEILKPTTRVELTFRRDIGCSLRDAYMPASLFYEYASPSLVVKPSDVPTWDSHAAGWKADVSPAPLTYQQFQKRVDESPELDALVQLADELGPGATRHLVRTFCDRLGYEIALPSDD